uniref:ATP-grasp domain-containing protein n=1 Tax=Eubacterium sp. TaxID=142586 RepID=UPI003FEF3980
MNGILAVNHFLKGEKYDTLHKHLSASAKKCGINLNIKTNLELATQKAQADFVLFWDKDINLARRIEKSGVPVFNSAESIEKCDDKGRTYIELDGIVPQPKTLIAPKCYFKSDMSEFVEKAIDILTLPLIFKESFGSFGAQVFLCNTKEEIYSHISEKPFILQKFIIDSKGHDKRIEIIGGKFICAAERENKNDFRSNVTNGGTLTPCKPTEKE